MNKVNKQLFIAPKELQCRKLRIFGTPKFSRETESEFCIIVNQRLYLYGVGIYIGCETTSTPDCDEVTITIDVDNFQLKKEVPLKRDVSVVMFLFNKITVTSECSLKVTITEIEDSSTAELFGLLDCVPADKLGNAYLTIAGTQLNRVAYILFNVDENSVQRTTGDVY